MPVLPSGTRRNMKAQSYLTTSNVADDLAQRLLERLAASGIADPQSVAKGVDSQTPVAPSANQPSPPPPADPTNNVSDDGKAGEVQDAMNQSQSPAMRPAPEEGDLKVVDQGTITTQKVQKALGLEQGWTGETGFNSDANGQLVGITIKLKKVQGPAIQMGGGK